MSGLVLGAVVPRTWSRRRDTQGTPRSAGSKHVSNAFEFSFFIYIIFALILSDFSYKPTMHFNHFHPNSKNNHATNNLSITIESNLHCPCTLKPSVANISSAGVGVHESLPSVLECQLTCTGHHNCCEFMAQCPATSRRHSPCPSCLQPLQSSGPLLP